MRRITKLMLISLVLIMCFSTATGVTMATSVTGAASEEGIIRGGTLNAQLIWSQDLVNWDTAKNATIYNNTFWEPGAKQLRYFEVINAGSLGYSYELSVDAEDFSELAAMIDVYCAPISSTQAVGRDLSGMVYLGTLDALEDGILAKGTLESDGVQRYALVLKMREEADNRFGGMPLGDFRIRLDATQIDTDQ